MSGVGCLIALGVLLVLALLLWLTASLIGLLITLVVAGLIGWGADRLTPGDLPYGLVGAVGAGLLGALLGAIVFDGFGPEIASLSVIPAFVGAIVVALAAEAFGIGRERTASS
jgi:uncharacterized membrane protein YeaQ/YmgE (transglycosylase-associated protein family)